MKIILEKENFLKNTVRDIIAVNPLVSLRRLQELVENNTERSISDKYLAKLIHKIRREVIIKSDRTKMNERLAEVRERFRVLKDDLQRSLYWKPRYLQYYGIKEPNFKERLAAMKLLAQLELALFRAEILAGAFENQKVAISEMSQHEILQTNLREGALSVSKTWKLSLNETQTRGLASGGDCVVKLGRLS